MVFTKLSVQDKDAFFGLLDEYFQSRPELFGQNGTGRGLAGTDISTAAAASIVQHALAPGNATGSANGGAGGASSKSNNPYRANMPSHVDVAHAMTVGRVAAASLAFSGGGGGLPLSQTQSQHVKPGVVDLPSLPRRAASTTPVHPSLDRAVTTPGMEVDKLVAKKTSVFAAFKKPDVPAVVAIPPAFAPPKNTFGPPPVRRGGLEATNANAGTGGAQGGGPTVGTHAQRLAPPLPPPPAPESEEGEWAEVLYDYSSEDPGDLAIEAGTRVFVTDKSSDDWWTGHVEGQERQGLFPASYVRLL